MTLITHFRNKNISVIASDTMQITQGHKFYYNSKKVCKLADGIIGYYGYAANQFDMWLFNSDEIDKSNYTVNKVVKLYKELVNKNENTDPFSIVISTIKESLLYSELNSTPYNIPSQSDNIEHNLKVILDKRIFFSPIRNNDLKIDVLHNSKLEKLFYKCFVDIYKTKFDVNLLGDDENLKELLSLFYAKINVDDNLNKSVIGGPVNFYIMNNKNSIISNCIIGNF